MKIEITSGATLEQVLTNSIPFVSNECRDPFQGNEPCFMPGATKLPKSSSTVYAFMTIAARADFIRIAFNSDWQYRVWSENGSHFVQLV